VTTGPPRGLEPEASPKGETQAEGLLRHKRALTGTDKARCRDLSRELSSKSEAKAEGLLGHEGPRSGPECTRRDSNPHTLQYRNLNPVRRYRDAPNYRETRILQRVGDISRHFGTAVNDW
jgi:hypothetical protein